MHSRSPSRSGLLPIEVDAPTPFTLIAVWACRIGSKNVDNYVGQIYYALTSHPEWFNGSPVVLAGDLNSNTVWDSRHEVINHSSVVKHLGRARIGEWVPRSLPRDRKVERVRPTIYFYRRNDRTFHIDYIFIPQRMGSPAQDGRGRKFETWSKLRTIARWLSMWRGKINRNRLRRLVCPSRGPCVPGYPPSPDVIPQEKGFNPNINKGLWKRLPLPASRECTGAPIYE